MTAIVFSQISRQVRAELLAGPGHDRQRRPEQSQQNSHTIRRSSPGLTVRPVAGSRPEPRTDSAPVRDACVADGDGLGRAR